MSSESELLGEWIAEQAAHLDAATQGLLTALREYDRSGNWYAQGFPRCADWLSWRVGWSLGTARDHLRVANKLGELPLIDDALRTGELSYSKVRAIVRVATPQNEAVLLEDARHTTAAQLDTLCRKYATVVRASKQIDKAADDDERSVCRYDLEDGMVRIQATLHPEEAAIVWAALERVAAERARSKESSPAVPHASAAASEPSSTRPRFNRADALVELAEAVLRGDSPDRSPTELVVTVAAETLRNDAASAEPIASLSDGTCVSAETARRLACDCGVVGIIVDEAGNPRAVSGKTRTIPAPLKRALLQRDRCCRFPSCTNRIFMHGHHIQHWANGGETVLENLLGLCAYHHRFVHEYGYRVELDLRQQPRFFHPNGREVLQVPESARPSNLGWSAILDANAALGITATTNQCRWDGSRVDYSACVDELVSADGLQ